MSSEIDTGTTFEKFVRGKSVYVDKRTIEISYPKIPLAIWKQIPEHAIQILEEAGYTKYDRKTDSIVFIGKNK